MVIWRTQRRLTHEKYRDFETLGPRLSDVLETIDKVDIVVHRNLIISRILNKRS
jgi:hypothetical protein